MLGPGWEHERLESDKEGKVFGRRATDCRQSGSQVATFYLFSMDELLVSFQDPSGMPLPCETFSDF